MTATKYTGPRRCSCGQRAEIIVDTGREDASHTTLLCWQCADGLIGILKDLFRRVEAEGKKEVA